MPNPRQRPASSDPESVGRGHRRVRFRVRGTVQGVGFRPFVVRLASDLGVGGWVGNEPGGVVGVARGPEAAMERFLSLLGSGAPPPAHVEELEVSDLEGDDLEADDGGRDVGADAATDGFRVRDSAPDGPPAPTLAPDLALCRDCRADLERPGGRHHRDPFLSCTRCGPRWSIADGLPWDRERTTLRDFPRCPDCEREYRDPDDRRFRAEGITCPACGPRLSFRTFGEPGEPARHGRPLDAAIAVLDRGGVVAVKGLGAVHLAVDATRGGVVAELRRRKGRDDKPLAVLVADLAVARALCDVDDATAALLCSATAPIVLCRRRADREVPPHLRIAGPVAPGCRDLGLLLPYTPLHRLLATGAGGPLVLTSANVGGAPVAYRDEDLGSLGTVADAVLAHDRAIATPVEDSVARILLGRAQVLRRSRGHVPATLPLPGPVAEPVLALGADLKSTCGLAVGDRATLSAHLGDLHHPAAQDVLGRAAERLVDLLGAVPSTIAHDLHPDYASTRVARRLAGECGARTVAVQHHHAHLAAVLAEHGRQGPALGVAYDGLGLGTDGTWWGGELMLVHGASFRRVGHLDPVPMPGGGAAAREPWRMAAAHLDAAGRGPDDPDAAWRTIVAMARSGTRAPATSSMGRLFDAVAHLVTGRRQVTYEGQAAVELEGLVADDADPDDHHRYADLIGVRADGTLVLPSSAVVAAVDHDLRAGTDPRRVAARFHHGVAALTVEALERLRAAHRCDTVALGGGVMQNRVLTETLVSRLRDGSFDVLVARRVPPNDGGIAYGQLAVAAAAAARPRSSPAVD